MPRSQPGRRHAAYASARSAGTTASGAATRSRPTDARRATTTGRGCQSRARKKTRLPSAVVISATRNARRGGETHTGDETEPPARSERHSSRLDWGFSWVLRLAHGLWPGSLGAATLEGRSAERHRRVILSALSSGV